VKRGLFNKLMSGFRRKHIRLIFYLSYWAFEYPLYSSLTKKKNVSF